MSSLYVGLLVVLVAPLVLARVRTSLIGLSLQGLIMGWLVLEAGRPPTVAVIVVLVDLLLLRGILAPLALYRVAFARQRAGLDGALTVSLFTWAMAGVAIFLAHRFGALLGHGEESAATHLFVAGAALLLGLLVLGTQTQPFGQVVGVLRVENAIALFELASPETPPLPIQIGLVLVYVATVATFAVLLRRLPDARATLPAIVEEATL